jgi:hypothetical protein
MNIYDLITLLGVLRVQKSIVPFWGKWFTTTMTFDTEAIAFDKVSDDYRKLAPFVSPNVQGRIQKQSGYSTTSYTPAYVKPLDAVRPNQTLVRRAGESLITGTLSPQQRYAIIVGNLLASQKIKIDNRIEWMRAQALIYGKVTVEGKDYPRVTIDFQRDPSLTITLVGSAKWDQGTANPLKDLGTGKTSVNNLSGAVVRDYVFGANAWSLFYAKLDPTKIQNNTLRGSEGTVSAFLDGLEGVEFAGTIAGVNGAGQMNLWVYTQKYLDEAGVTQDMLDTNTVVGLSDMIQGVNCFGAIEDLDSLVATEYFPKMWKEENPSRCYLMTQSAPLTVPKQPNAGFCIKVA